MSNRKDCNLIYDQNKGIKLDLSFDYYGAYTQDLRNNLSQITLSPPKA
jgi:hypothetical protein